MSLPGCASYFRRRSARKNHTPTTSLALMFARAKLGTTFGPEAMTATSLENRTTKKMATDLSGSRRTKTVIATEPSLVSRKSHKKALPVTMKVHTAPLRQRLVMALVRKQKRTRKALLLVPLT